MSGGPVTGQTTGTLFTYIGLVREHLPDIEREWISAGGTVYACPAALCEEAVVRLRDSLPESTSQNWVSEQLVRAAEDGDLTTVRRITGQLQGMTDVEPEPWLEAWLQRAALDGDASAAFALGRLTERDPARSAEAMDWYRRAAFGGSVLGQATFGLRLRQANENEAAIPWLEAAAESEDVMAAATLALIYKDRDRPGDDVRAEIWALFAARRGDTMAAHTLAQMFRGRGELSHYEEWERRAAAGGDSLAQTELGKYLLEGGKVQEGLEWLEKSAESNSEARVVLEEFGRASQTTN
jgi:TPR repeat protein